MSHFAWLPWGAVGPMISGMAPVKRVATAFVAGSLLLTGGVRSASAQSAENGWFNETVAQPGTSPAPMGQGQSPGPGVPATPAAPAAPGAPGEPLAPSPLLNTPQPAAPVATQEDQDPRSLTAWNSYLDPYGTWVDDGRYGRVWVPSPGVVGPDFAPYSTGGRWVLDEQSQWTWASDYPFGWVTFHYGRWVWIAGTGWAWIPGMTYAPAWVAWRVPTSSYAYVGWAPLPPSYVWFGGFAVWYPYYPVYPWVFCPSEYVFYPHVHHYVVHDHYGMAYAAHYTRPYVPATPHPGPHTSAAPHGPSPQAARVPATAVPRERVSSAAITPRGTAISSASYSRQQVAQGDARRQAFDRSPMTRALPQSPLVRQPPVRQPMLTSNRAPTYASRPASSFSSAGPALRSASAPRPAPVYSPVRSVPLTSTRSSPHITSDPRMDAVRSAPRSSWGGGSHFSGGGGGSRMGGHMGSHFGGGLRGGGGRR